MLHPIVLKFKTPTNSRVLVMLRIAGPRGGTKKRDRILVLQSDRAVQIHGGRRGWRYFAMYASQVARAAIGMVGMKFGLSPGELFLCVVIA